MISRNVSEGIKAKLSLTFENYSKLYKLSPEMAEFLGKNKSTKREITDRVWSYCKRHSLLRESYIVIDKRLEPLFGQFARDLAKKEEESKKKEEPNKKEGEFKINLGKLSQKIRETSEAEKSDRLLLCRLNDAIFKHIISIASFEFEFEIPAPQEQTKPQIKPKPDDLMDENWHVFDVLVKLQSENINEAMPFFVQKVIFEEKEREKILNSQVKGEFNEVMVENEKIKLDNQHLLNLRSRLLESFHTLNLQSEVG